MKKYAFILLSIFAAHHSYGMDIMDSPIMENPIRDSVFINYDVIEKKMMNYNFKQIKAWVSRPAKLTSEDIQSILTWSFWRLAVLLENSLNSEENLLTLESQFKHTYLDIADQCLTLLSKRSKNALKDNPFLLECSNFLKKNHSLCVNSKEQACKECNTQTSLDLHIFLCAHPDKEE